MRIGITFCERYRSTRELRELNDITDVTVVDFQICPHKIEHLRTFFFLDHSFLSLSSASSFLKVVKTMASFNPSANTLSLFDDDEKNNVNFEKTLDNLLYLRSESTHNQRNAAVKLFDMCRKRVGLCAFRELDPLVHMSGMRAYVLLSEYSMFLIDVGLRKPDGNNYPKTTILNYFSHFHQAIIQRCKDSKLNDVIDSEQFKQMKKSLDDRIQKRDIHDHVSLKRVDTMPLYKELGPLLSDWEVGSDLISLLHRLMACTTVGEESCVLRFKLCLNFHAAGRTGEFISLNYNDFAWESHFESLTALWPEFKNLRKYLLTFGVDLDSYASSVFHAFACAAIAEDFLVRKDTISKEDSAYVFHDEFMNFTTKSASNKVTKKMKEFSPPEIKSMISGKSIRQAVVTMLALHPRMTFYFLCPRSGHKIPDNSASYFKCTKAALLPSQNVLCGENNIHQLPTAPRLQAVMNRGEIYLFLRKLYPISYRQLPMFQTKGKLRPFLEVATADLIRSYPEMIEKFPKGKMKDVLVKVEQAVVDCGQAKSVVGADRTLRKWAKQINDDFAERREQKRLEYLRKTPEGQELLLLNEKYGEQTRKLGQMEKNVDAMSLQIAMLRAENKTISTNMEKMMTMMANFQHQYRKPTAAHKHNENNMSATLSNTDLTSPLSSDSPSDLSSGFASKTCSTTSSNTPRALQLVDLTPGRQNNTSVEARAELSPQEHRLQAAKQRPKMQQPAVNSYEIMMKARGTEPVGRVETSSGAKYFIKTLLKQFHLHSKTIVDKKECRIDKMNFPAWVVSSNKKKFLRGMVATAAITTEREVRLLAADTTTKAMVSETAQAVEDRMRECMGEVKKYFEEGYGDESSVMIQKKNARRQHRTAPQSLALATQSWKLQRSP